MADYHFENLLVERDGPHARVTINRPKVLNALNQQVLEELHSLLDQKAFIDGLRVLVLSGSGDKAFVAGADIAAMRNLNAEEALAFGRLGQRFSQRLESASFLSIARVQGYAFGGGCELAMACDLLVASEKALFAQPEVDLGLIPGFGGTQRLAKRVGLPLALEILCAGRKLNGREAFQAGLVSQVCVPGELDAYIDGVVKNILKAAPRAVAETKKLARSSLETVLEHGLAAEATAFATCFAGSEAAEGLSAFLEKRPARFRG